MHLHQQLRRAARVLAAQPGFTLLSVITLGLGMGGATLMFSFTMGVMLDPLPYRDMDRVVTLQVRDAAGPSVRSMFRSSEIRDYQQQVKAFEDVIALGYEDVLYSTNEGTEVLVGGLVSGNAFAFYGIHPEVGRTLIPADSLPESPPVFVMSHRLWSTRFEYANLVGSVFVLNGVPTTLIGIIPARFNRRGADLWQPVVFESSHPRARLPYWIEARLQPGISVEQARIEVNAAAKGISPRYVRDYPANFTVGIVRVVDEAVDDLQGSVAMLWGATILLLLIASSNVANMSLARTFARKRESAILVSLGASRSTVVSQSMVENLLLALMATAFGYLTAYAGAGVLRRTLPERLIPEEAVLRIDLTALLFGVGIAVLTAVACSVVQYFQTFTGDQAQSLRSGGTRASQGPKPVGLLGALVIVDVALSLTLVSAAALLMRSMITLQTVDLGMNLNNLLIVRAPLPRERYATAGALTQFYSSLLPRLQSLPGVATAATTSALPPFGGSRIEVDIADRTHQERWEALLQLCSEEYFETVGMRIIRGRLLTGPDIANARRVVVVNQQLVSQYFGSQDPIGKQLHLTTLARQQVENPSFEVVGIVADAKNQGPHAQVLPEVFVPYSITAAYPRGLLLKTHGPPEALLNSVKREIWNLDRGIGMTLTGSVNEYIERYSYAGPRFAAIVSSSYAVLALVLSGSGVFSVLAFSVLRQAREIGIRTALGARPDQVMALVLSRGLRTVSLGVVLGVVMSLGLGQFLRSQLFNVAPNDPATLLAAVAIVMVAGLVACYFPARSAIQVDPLSAIRSE